MFSPEHFGQNTVEHTMKRFVSRIIGCLFAIFATSGLDAQSTLLQEYLNYPVLLQIGNSGGSGFFFQSSNSIYLLTAKHVLYDVSSTNAPLPLRGMIVGCSSWKTFTSSVPTVANIDLAAANAAKEVRHHTNHDIAAVRVGMVATNGNPFQLPWFSITSEDAKTPGITVVTANQILRFDDIVIGSDVYLFGYPISLRNLQLDQLEPLYPLLRRGILAGKNHKRKRLILDCPVYKGNSGGPVILQDKSGFLETSYSAIGIATEFVPFIENWVNSQMGYTNTTVSNSGYSIVEPMDVILEMLWQ